MKISYDCLPIVPSAAQLRAARLCLEKRVPFALWAPGMTQFRLVADPEGGCVPDRHVLLDPDWEGFYINFFANDEEYPICVADAIPGGADAVAEAVESLDGPLAAPFIEPSAQSTDRMKYIATVNELIGRLKHKGDELEKVVISRVIAERSARDLLDVALDYWNRLPHTMRFLYYTPETGTWLGATPELLISLDAATGEYTSMALAGTVTADHKGPWDGKNEREHLLVVHYLDEMLRELGSSSPEMISGEAVFGPVKHLRTLLKGKLEEEIDPAHVFHMLSPTPALSGYPPMQAIARILMCEAHSRYCYSGFLGWKRGQSFHTYVNLRSAFVGEPDAEGARLFNIYVGGGIMPRSKAADEWEETCHKASLLLDSLHPQQPQDAE